MTAPQIAELQHAAMWRVIAWTAFPDRAEAHAVGVHSERGYVLTVRAHTVRFWNWQVRFGRFPKGGHEESAEAALSAAEAAYSRIAAELHDEEQVA